MYTAHEKDNENSTAHFLEEAILFALHHVRVFIRVCQTPQYSQTGHVAPNDVPRCLQLSPEVRPQRVEHDDHARVRHNPSLHIMAADAAVAAERSEALYERDGRNKNRF